MAFLATCAPLLRTRDSTSPENHVNSTFGMFQQSALNLSVPLMPDHTSRRLTDECFNLENYKCMDTTCIPAYLDTTGVTCGGTYSYPAKCIDHATCSGGYYTCDAGYQATWNDPGRFGNFCQYCYEADNLHECIFTPTSAPTTQPTSDPSGQPSCQPTSVPSSQPSAQPSARPSVQPTSQPSVPTSIPTMEPSGQPTVQPTSVPSSQPSMKPTGQPSGQPTNQPSSQPSGQPSTQPSNLPTGQPTSMPTNPTSRPSGIPSSNPTPVPNLSTQINLIPWQPILITLCMVFLCSCGYLLHTYFRRTHFSLSNYLADKMGWRDKVHEKREKQKEKHLSKRKVAPLQQVEAARNFKHNGTGGGGGVVKKSKTPLGKKMQAAARASALASGRGDDSRSFGSPRSNLGTPLSRSPSVGGSGRRVVNYSFGSPDSGMEEESKTDTIRAAEGVFSGGRTTARSSSTTAQLAGVSPGPVTNLFSGRRVVKNKVQPEDLHDLY